MILSQLKPFYRQDPSVLEMALTACMETAMAPTFHY